MRAAPSQAVWPSGNAGCSSLTGAGAVPDLAPLLWHRTVFPFHPDCPKAHGEPSGIGGHFRAGFVKSSIRSKARKGSAQALTLRDLAADGQGFPRCGGSAFDRGSIPPLPAGLGSRGASPPRSAARRNPQRCAAPCRRSASAAMLRSSGKAPDSPWPVMNCTRRAVSRRVSGIIAAAAAEDAAVTPGMISKATPAAFSAVSSSSSRPNTPASPLLSRTTRAPVNACSTSKRLT
jgi:hypothetical protein